MESFQDIGHTLVVLGQTLATLLVQLAALGLHWMLWIIWAAWWLAGVNAHKARHVLAIGGWAPAVLLILLIAIVWSRLDPHSANVLGVVTVPNFWWQLGYVTMLAAIAMICGWLQCLLHWTPADINLDPPAHGHAHGHDHGHSHH
jgi:hypothetical protein